MNAKTKRAIALGVDNDMVRAEHQIKHILGNTHVGTSYLGVIRAILTRAPGGWQEIKRCCKKWARDAGHNPRVYRRQFIRIVLVHHARNREEYRAVMYPRYK